MQVITLTGNDGNGNTVTCTFNLTLNDTTNPMISCPANQDVVLDNNCEASLADYTNGAVISDNCTADAAILVIQSPAINTIINSVGTVTTVTLTADDGLSLIHISEPTDRQKSRMPSSA